MNKEQILLETISDYLGSENNRLGDSRRKKAKSEPAVWYKPVNVIKH